MKIHYLGTCSGTEPKPGMHHTSIVFEINDILYWFDAGECCVHTAHNSVLDITKSKVVFVSHPHLDHTGGLANLFSALRKLAGMFKRPLVNNNTLDVFFPDMGVFEAVKTLACNSTERRRFVFTLVEHEMHDGLLYEDENIRVSALHNRHLKEDGSKGWHSYSFLIEAEGKKIIYSGDVAEPCELDDLIGEGCDYLIHETGHHAVADVCDYAISRKAKALRFTHHGRAILNDRPAMEKLVSDKAASANIAIKICYDGMIEEI